MKNIENLIKLYRTEHTFKDFYPRIINNIEKYPQYHLTDPGFLEGYRAKNIESGVSIDIISEVGDLRVDLPVWFGNINAAKKYLIIGLEPRDTRKDFNVEKISNVVFATPFGIEKSYSRYYKLFSDFINSNDSFYLFTDVVKKYDILSKVDKKMNDKNARKNFLKNAKRNIDFISKEFEIIQPTTILCLGTQVFNFINQHFSSQYKDKIKRITHPAAWGGTKKAQQELSEVFNPHSAVH